MTLDQLAALIVGVEADDLPELGRIHAGLTQLRDEAAAPSARPLLDRAIECVERVILREPDAAVCIDELGRIVTDLGRQGEEAAPTADPVAPPAPADVAASVDSAAPQQQQQPAAPPSETPAAGASPAIEVDDSLLHDFVVESLDHIQNAEASLLALESDPSDTEAINAVFRAFHTIKGTSGFLNLQDIQKVAHLAETLLDRARTGKVRLTGGYADLALESADTLKRMIERVQAGAELGGDEQSARDDLLARLANPEQAGVDESPTQPVPRVGDLLVSSGRAAREQVESVAAAKADRPIGEALIEAGVATGADVAQALRTQKKISGGDSGDATVRVSTVRLDGLINLVGELVIAQAMISTGSGAVGGDHNFARNVSQLNKITRELQDLGMSLRMVPLKSTFQKMARLVRDVARKSGKQVQFVTEGEDTEIDRNMVEALNDPLIHMIRNAVDHGIESPADRAAAGKPAVGTVTLRAYHAAGSVVIELQDDGKGLDPDKLVAKAVERGLIGSGQDLSENEIYKLIFAPGFSTAEKITDVSGRGVGMDVVRRNIEELRGRIDITSAVGRGSTFALRVPLTLAIIEGMLVRVGRERYVVPTISIRQAFRPQPGDIHTVAGRGEMVGFQGELVPVFRLHELFEVRGGCDRAEDALLMVVEDDSGQCALLVDEILGQQQVVIKSLGEGLGSAPGVSGGAILGDGRIGLILDVPGVLSLARRGGAGRSRTGNDQGNLRGDRRLAS